MPQTVSLGYCWNPAGPASWAEHRGTLVLRPGPTASTPVGTHHSHEGVLWSQRFGFRSALARTPLHVSSINPPPPPRLNALERPCPQQSPHRGERGVQRLRCLRHGERLRLRGHAGNVSTACHCVKRLSADASAHSIFGGAGRGSAPELPPGPSAGRRKSGSAPPPASLASASCATLPASTDFSGARRRASTPNPEAVGSNPTPAIRHEVAPEARSPKMTGCRAEFARCQMAQPSGTSACTIPSS